MPRTLRADVAEVDELLEGVAEAHGQLGALRRSLAPLERARRLAEVLIEQLGVHQARGAGAQKARSLAEELGGLVGGIEQSLGRGIEQVDRELRQVRQSGQRLRLLPAAACSTCSSAWRATPPRAWAGASSSRRRAPTCGSTRMCSRACRARWCRLSATRSRTASSRKPSAPPRASRPPAKCAWRSSAAANRAVFRCSDDGRGIDLPAVRRAAARGLSDIEVSRLGDDEVVRLLLKGGISTARTVTPMAGRGVGLDVVREIADRLGGRVGMKTEAGRGMTLELAVPISLSSLDALLVDADDRTVAIPLEAIRQIVRLRPQDIARAGDGESILFAGQAIPFAPLAAPLRAGGARDATTPRACSAVIIDAPSGRAALGVTQLRGTETIVVQPLPDAIAADPIVAGAALDAEGNPLLVLHPEALVAAAARTEARERPAPRQRPPVLIVDDSLTTRMLEQSILELAGYDVDMATSGEEALEKAAARRYALFLVDVEMPGMDGFTFVATTQKDPDAARGAGDPGHLARRRGRSRARARRRRQGVHRQERARSERPARADRKAGRVMHGTSISGAAKRIRVLVVEDSATVRGRLCEVLNGDQDIEVVGEATDGKYAIELCHDLRPDVLSMDMMLPLMTGLAATEYIMAHFPTPILIVSASTNRGELFRTYDALAAGAVDVLEKPRGDEHDGEWERRYLSTIKLVSRIKVITHLRARLPGLGRATDALAATCAHARDRRPHGAAPGGDRRVDRRTGRAGRDPARPARQLPAAGADRAAHQRALRRGLCRMAGRAERAPGRLRARRRARSPTARAAS